MSLNQRGASAEVAWHGSRLRVMRPSNASQQVDHRMLWLFSEDFGTDIVVLGRGVG